MEQHGHDAVAELLAQQIAQPALAESHEGSVARHRVLKAGERMGMIRYGSRVDVYFNPDEVDLKIHIGDKVKGGETVLGAFK